MIDLIKHCVQDIYLVGLLHRFIVGDAIDSFIFGNHFIFNRIVMDLEWKF